MPASALAASRIFAIYFLFLCACAKVGDPLPPLVQPPDTTQDLRVELRGDSVRVYFPVPSPNIEWVEVFRHCNPQAPLNRFSLITRISANELMASEQANVYVFVDRTAQGTPQCRYAIRFVDGRGQNSDFSNVAGVSTGTSD